ncbi:hypothetical protein PPL_06830 [Heterostelium album PN500]|uniref:Uncharacterized protein n=1 Tax=Heterostelium pallidum (strain ATCC 26659 / Pp 5 / PN500) TaxID=670386 RepID=D3BDM8_HETP5|nr:hypothetical protein PPL_06830 [Heterostelium album PN500]EFA80009.1 hypothetical protein PPL_06830 [Heterostelium album PN500]|eukprot:XP_020432129.1 hypothetical protein PPL_06830 [Heterostelium album PN500]
MSSEKRLHSDINKDQYKNETYPTSRVKRRVSHYCSRRYEYDGNNLLSDLIKIYDQYFKSKNDKDDSSETRLKCVQFFVRYHNDTKYPHYFDVKGYNKFIAEVFFDRSEDVFNEILKLKCARQTKILLDIYYMIIKDNRFNTFFKGLNESDEAQLKSKISRICDRFEEKRNEPLGFFTYNNLYDIVYNGKSIDKETDNNNDKSTTIIGAEQTIKTIETRGTTDIETTKTDTTNHIKISDLILCKIISKFVAFDKDKDEISIRNNRFKRHLEFIPYLIDGGNVMDFALVSKQFFRVVSKIINDNLFYWNSYIDINNNSEYNLIKSAPLYFDYESIKYIPYDKGIEYVNQLLSRVEVFTMESDEFDYSINSEVRRLEELDPEEYPDEIYDEYREAVLKDGYLIRPPIMPNLKEIIVLMYHGFEWNYCDFLVDLFANTPSGDGHGIERFAINILRDWNISPDCNNMDFLTSLLEYHSKTLKSITINRDSFRAIDFRLLVDILIDLAPTLKENNIDFKLEVYVEIDEFIKDNDNKAIIKYLLDNTIILKTRQYY